MMTVAQMIAESLRDRGVETVFGLPGGEVVELLDCLRNVGIEFVLVKNESSAVYMADVTARLTGKIGVVVTTLGPGATNAYVGMAHAYLDRAPVLLISAQTDAQLIGSHTHQVLDLQACFRPITKFTAELEAETALETWHFALSQLTNGRAGPVHLGLSDKIARSQIEGDANIRIQTTVCKDVETCAMQLGETLRDYKRPVIVVGVGLEPEAPYKELKAFAEMINAPVIDTPKGKGALPATHPLFTGTIGLTRTDAVYEMLDQADCILAIGFDVVELVKPWDQTAPVVWLSPWQNQDPRIPAAYEYVGRLKPLLRSFVETAVPYDSNWGELLTQYQQRQRSRPFPEAAAGKLSPQETLAIIRANTADDVVVTTDVGSHKIFTALDWEARTPNRYFLSNGLSAMGFGVPAAIAAAQVTGDPTVCITGDGGLAMIVGELALAVELDLPVIVVVMNDSALDLIRTAQQKREKTVHGTTFTNPDYRLIAQAYGLGYYFVDDGEACEQAMQTAVQQRKPCLIDVQIDPTGYPTAVKK